PDFSWNNYLHFWRNPMFPNLLLRSIRLAVTVTAISLLVSYPFAYFLARGTRRFRTTLLILVMVPFWTSYLIRTMSWLPILGIKGVVNYSLMTLQMVSNPVEVFLFNQFSVVLTLIHIYLPYMVVPIYLSLDRLDGRLLEAASDLGANPLRTFWHVTLPLSLPGVVAGIVMLIVLSFNDSNSITLPWGGFTWRWYRALADNQSVFVSLKNSLTLGLMTAVISTVIGGLAAFAFRSRFRGQVAVMRMLLLPF